MVAFKGRDRYDDDYTYDDSLTNEYDEEYEDEEERDLSLSSNIINGFSSFVKNAKASWQEKNANKKAEYDDGDEDYEEDEEYEDEDDNAEYKAKKKSRLKSIISKKRKRDTEDDYYEYEDGEEYMEEAPKKSRQTRDSKGYSKEDYERFDQIYGTKGSYARAEQAEKNRAKVFGARKPKDAPAQKKNGSNVTSMFGDKVHVQNVSGLYKFTPKNVEDTNNIADYIMNAYAVVIDLKGMPKNDILRILDFIDGVAYVLDYSFDELSKEMYICAPKGYLKIFNNSRYNND